MRMLDLSQPIDYDCLTAWPAWFKLLWSLTDGFIRLTLFTGLMILAGRNRWWRSRQGGQWSGITLTAEWFAGSTTHHYTTARSRCDLTGDVGRTAGNGADNVTITLVEPLETLLTLVEPLETPLTLVEPLETPLTLVEPLETPARPLEIRLTLSLMALRTVGSSINDGYAPWD